MPDRTAKPAGAALQAAPASWCKQMTQAERRIYLIRSLLKERPQYPGIALPPGEREQRALLRSLCNIRPPVPASAEFLSVQDAYLSERLAERGVTELRDLTPVRPGLYLWQGDITTLAADAIVNAANSQMLGCFVPCHGCIDNAIHTLRECSSAWSVPILWQNKKEKNPPAGQKSQRLIICHAVTCCTPSAQSSTDLSPKQTVACWQAVTAPVFHWRQTTV